MNKAYLVLRLNGVHQSYSMNRTEKYIPTSLFPTKSSIVGLLGCALGYPRGDIRLMKLCDNLMMGARMDKTPIKEVDYQIIRGGFIKVLKIGKKKGQKKFGHITAEAFAKGEDEKGKDKTSSENKVINKEYLSDSSYTVILEGPLNIINMCAEAVKDPVWVYSLGKSNCIPSLPITGPKSESMVREDFESLSDALKKVSVLRGKSRDNCYLYELEVSAEEKRSNPMGSILEYYDNTGSYVNYNYRKRYVKRGTVKIEN